MTSAQIGFWISVVLSLSTMAIRVFIEPRLTNIPTQELSYEAFAHIWVGMLFGFWLAGKQRVYLWMALLISFFELGMFLVQKFGIV